MKQIIELKETRPITGTENTTMLEYIEDLICRCEQFNLADIDISLEVLREIRKALNDENR